MKTILTSDDFKNVFDVQKSEKERILSCYIEKAEDNKEEEKKEDFKHHRLMTGYHSMKAHELNDEALKLSGSTNPELHDVAKTKKAEASRHAKTADEHREKSKSMHNPEEHGHWNDTIPTKEEALKYGSKQAKLADKETDVIEKEEDYKEGDEDKDVKKSEGIEKGGEGSRGGKIIGHTKSGKPVYDTVKHPSHSNFTKEDHKDSAHIHAVKYHIAGEKLMNYGTHRKSVEKHEAGMEGHLEAAGYPSGYISEDGRLIEKSEEVSKMK